MEHVIKNVANLTVIEFLIQERHITQLDQGIKQID